MRRDRGRGVALAAVLATTLSAERAWAGDDIEDLEALLSENVVSGASKEAETASDAPALTTTITAEDIRRYGIRSIDEAIDFLGMGMVTQNPLHSVEVGGRGVLITADYGNHVLLVVDGHVLNEPWNGTAYFEQGAAIPMELIDHIELVLGPGSVLYGGSAMLGVVNVVTKRAAAFKGLHIVGEGAVSPEQGRKRSFTSFAPGDLGKTGRLGVGGGHTFHLLGKPLEWIGQVEVYRQDGPSFEWGPQVATDDDGAPRSFGPRAPAGVWAGRTRGSYDTTVPTVYTRADWRGFSLMLRGASYERSTPYVNSFNQVRGDFDDPRSGEQDTFLSADLQHRARFGRWSTFARGYFDNYTFDQAMYEADGSGCAFPVAGTCVTKVRGRSRWLGAEAQATYDWLGDGTLQSMVGVDGRVRRIASATDSVELESDRVAGTLGAKEVTELAGAAYGQQRYSPVRFLQLNGGARFDHDPRGGNRLSPRGAASVTPWRGGTLKAIYSEAFRAPSFYEKYFDDGQQRPALTLSPEVVRSAEASFEQRLGRHRLVFGAFRSWWSDMIGLRLIGEDHSEYGNISRIDNWGYNARVDGTAGALAYGLSATGAHTRRDDGAGGHPLPVAPQVFGNARLAYKLPGALPTVALATTLVGARPADRAMDGGFPVTPYAPAQARFRLTVSNEIQAIPGLSYRVAGEIATKGNGPYVAGPIQTADSSPTPTNAELAPVNRATVFATLRYEFGGR